MRAFSLPDAGRCLLRCLAGVMLTAGCVASIGCSHGSYTYSGVDLTTRSFHEDPDFRDTYFGIDLNFTVEVEDPHVSGGSSARPLSDY